MDFALRFGRFLREETACGILGVSPETLEQLRATGQILQVETVDGIQVYPELQFDGVGSSVSGLREVLQILLPAAADGWAVLYWLTAPLAVYGDRTLMDLLRAGSAGETEAVLELAKHDATVWGRA